MTNDLQYPETPLLEMRGIGKDFPGVRALDDVDLTLYGGEVLALVGENGAGKSTLIKILGGAHSADQGTIRFDGNETDISSPLEAIRLGVAMIYQELNLVPGLSAADNIFLCREQTSMGFVAAKQQTETASRLLSQISLQFNPETLCSDLSIAEKQGVEIAKALSQQAKILVMDEPSAVLTPGELAGLFETVRELKAQGIGIIYITHRLEEVFELADRVMVLRDGRNVSEYSRDSFDRRELIESMVGRKLVDEFPKRDCPIGDVKLRAMNLLRAGVVNDVSLEVKRGEILGITGLIGAGRTEVARLLFGADQLDSGQIELNGKPVRIRSPRDAIMRKIGLLPEDRKSQGLVAQHSVQENFSLPNLSTFSRWGWMRGSAESKALKTKIDELKIKVAQYAQAVSNLSGGNQQKIVLAKWLQQNCDVVIIDEPTRGIDVGAKYEIYELMNQLCAAGKSIIMISSELPEIIGMSDRILVMRGGQISGEFDNRQEVTQQQIMELAVG